jgi:hypothetical protein
MYSSARGAWLEHSNRSFPRLEYSCVYQVSRLCTLSFVLIFTTYCINDAHELVIYSLHDTSLSRSLLSISAINCISYQRFGISIFSIYGCDGVWVGEKKLKRCFTAVSFILCSFACFVHYVQVQLWASRLLLAVLSYLFLTSIGSSTVVGVA